jgi:hypothetical protein
MDKHNLVFGAGTRTCIRKNVRLHEITASNAAFADFCCDLQISLSVIHKLVPLTLQQFKFELESPSKSWETHDLWFNKQTGIEVRVSGR